MRNGNEMGRRKRKEPPQSAERRPRRFVSKKWDKRLEIIGIIAAVPIVGAVLLDLASIITQPHWHGSDLYHAATLIVPLAFGAWMVSIIIKEKRARRRK